MSNRRSIESFGRKYYSENQTSLNNLLPKQYYDPYFGILFGIKHFQLLTL